MLVAQTVFQGFILVALIVIIWQTNRESAIPFEFKFPRKEDRYL